MSFAAKIVALAAESEPVKEISIDFSANAAVTPEMAAGATRRSRCRACSVISPERPASIRFSRTETKFLTISAGCPETIETLHVERGMRWLDRNRVVCADAHCQRRLPSDIKFRRQHGLDRLAEPSPYGAVQDED